MPISSLTILNNDWALDSISFGSLWMNISYQLSSVDICHQWHLVIRLTYSHVWWCRDILGAATGSPYIVFIYIVKYRQSIAFRYIYIVAILLWLVREKATNRPQKVAQVAVCCHSEHHSVFITCQHQGCLHYCLWQGTGTTIILRNAWYCLQCVWFVTSWLSIYAALLRTIDRSNPKLSEGIKRLI